jgi:gamma-glutamylcyclotransferase (GGCT)/AIG2-like uncharacterized protein YtfP
MDNLLFVYGSLMENFFNYKYIKDKVIYRKYARTKGKLFHQVEKGYPAMIEGQDFVYGELIKLDDWDNTIKLLDKLENYFGERNPENEYNRVVICVETLDDKKTYKAFAYSFNLKDSKNFLAKNVYIQNGNWREFIEKQAGNGAV